MAGHGKGPLRIAIEDFLTTSKLSDIIFGGLKNIIEKLELEAIDTYEEIGKSLDMIQYLPTGLTPAHFRSGMKQRPINLIAIALGLATMVIGAMIGMFAPVMRLGTYKVDKYAKSYRPDPMAVMAGMRRRGATNLANMPVLDDLGLAPEIREDLYGLSKQLLTAYEYIAAFRRGKQNEEELTRHLNQIGYESREISLLLHITEVIPNVGDLLRMAVREAFSPDVVKRFQYDEAFPGDVVQYARQQGLSEDWVKRYWYAHWELPSPNQAFEMLHRLRPGTTDNPFTTDDLDLLLRTADYPSYFRKRLTAISYQPVTRVDIRRMYKLGVYTAAMLPGKYQDIGYNEKDAKDLADFTVKYESGSSEDKDSEIKGLTEAVSKRMFMKGLINRDQYKKRLTDLKYPADVAELIIKLTEQELAEDLSPDFRKTFINDMVNDIEAAFSAGMISDENARAALSSLGISPANIEIIIKKESYQADLNELNESLKLITESYINGSRTRDMFIADLGSLGISGQHQQKIIQRVEQQRTFRTRRLTEAQYRAAVKKGIMTQDDYIAAMIGLGISDSDINILVGLYFTEGEINE